MDIQKKRVRVLTLNIKGLPNFYDKTSRERTRELVPLLLKENPDVICLQEVFDADVRKIIVDGLSVNYPEIISNFKFQNRGVKKIFNWLGSSGLMIISKYEISWHQYLPFKYVGGPDTLSWKGVLAAKIVLYSGISQISFIIFNTHLNANSNTLITKKFLDNDIFRKKQLRFINSFVMSQEHDNIIICGDFNIKDLIINKRYEDVFRSLNPDSLGYTVDYYLNKSDVLNYKSRMRIDYTFIYSRNYGSSQIKPITSDIYFPGQVPYDILSDHFGVISELEVCETKNTNHRTYETDVLPSFWKRICCAFCCFGKII